MEFITSECTYTEHSIFRSQFYAYMHCPFLWQFDDQENNISKTCSTVAMVMKW